MTPLGVDYSFQRPEYGPSMARPKILAEINRDDNGPWIEFAGRCYRPQASNIAYSGVYAFFKDRKPVGATERASGTTWEVLPYRNKETGEKFLMVHDKNLRELWADHGDVMSTTLPWDPWDGLSWNPSPAAWAGGITGVPWHRTLTYAAVLRGKALQ